jgi:hypothetical protein
MPVRTKREPLRKIVRTTHPPEQRNRCSAPAAPRPRTPTVSSRTAPRCDVPFPRRFAPAPRAPYLLQEGAKASFTSRAGAPPSREKR